MPILKDKQDLSLLRLEGINGPIHFIVANEYGDEEASDDSQRYFYEEHSCPTNWLQYTVAVIDETGDEDPHGFLKHVRTVRVDKDFDPMDLDEEEGSWLKLFPEAAPKPAPAVEPPRLDATVVARAFEVMLPKHVGPMALLHNPHKDHEPAMAWAKNFEVDFVSAVEQQKVEATDEMWILKWASEEDKYVRLAAASLPALAQWLQDNGLAFGS
jgi:hypothetical protein